MKNNAEPKFEILQMPPKNTNSVLVSVGGRAVIFDPWGRVSDWEHVLDERNLKLHAIYATHGHSDHISAAPDLSKSNNVPWFLNDADKDLIMWGNPLMEYFEIPTIKPGFTEPKNLVQGEIYVLPGIKMITIESAGHSAGSVMFYFPDFKILISGDTIFHDGVGRTDFPGGNNIQLHKSVQKIKEMNLCDETYIVHGHGLDSTFGWLKHNHPMFLMGDCHCCNNKCCDHNNCCCDCNN